MAQPALRFVIGARVQCRTGRADGDAGWSSGVVVKHWYRESKWPQGRIAPYQVKLDVGTCIFAPVDEDRVIREATGLLKDGKIPVTCLTGFLGAGKTTLLNHILTVQHGKKYAIIENEVGSVGIDNQLLNDGFAQSIVESVTLLENGCLCCTVREDLVKALHDIVIAARARQKDDKDGKALDGIIIETTGLADPAPILQTFYNDQFVGNHCKMDGVITVVDSVNFVSQLTRERTKDAVNESAQQVAFADKVLLNKIDVASPEQIETATQAIRSVNAYVDICRCTLGAAPDAVPLEEMLRTGGFDLRKLLEAGDIDLSMCAQAMGEEDHASKGGHGVSGSGHGNDDSSQGGDDHSFNRQEHSIAFRHDLDVGSMVCEIRGRPISWSRFRRWLTELLVDPQDLYRYKGILAARKHPEGPVMRRVVQGVHDHVQAEVGAEWPEGEPFKSQMVLIGRNLDRLGWKKKFLKCAE